MVDRECIPLRKCDVIEEQDESEIIEIKAYCYNISSKKEVCKPGTCPVKKKYGQQEIRVEEYEEPEAKKITLIPLQTLKEKTEEQSTEDKPQSDEANGTENTESTNQSNDPKSENTDGPNKTSNVNDISEDAKNSKKVDIDDVIVEKQNVEKLNAEKPNAENVDGTEKAVPPVSSDNTQTSNQIKENLDKPAEICDCCFCDPCECGPRGLAIENVISAIKTVVHNSEELTKLLRDLSPEALTTIDNILIKEGKKALYWASGGAMSFIMGIEDENLRIAMREAWIRGEFDEMGSCHCLPHLCPCPGGHRIREDAKTTSSSKKGKSKQDQKSKKSKDGIKRRISDTCLCTATKHYLTPASSGTVSSDDLMTSTKGMYWRDLMICTCPRLDRTLAILKPEVVHLRDVVLRAITNYGMDILNERRVQLTPEQASELYAKYYGRTQFPNMIVSISYAPVVAFSIGGINAVTNWKKIIGPNGLLPSEWFFPDWIGREYGLLPDMPNTLHGSGNIAAGKRENRFFFPESIIEPIVKNSDDVKDYISKNVYPTLSQGLAMLTKSRPTDPITFLAEYLVYNNPFTPCFPANVCLAPT